MANRSRLDVDAFFGEVDQTQEVYSLRERVEQLEQELDQKIAQEQQLIAEIEQRRSQTLTDSERSQLQSQIDELRDYLQQTQGSVQYPVSKISRNPRQPRQTFDEEVEAMMLSLQTEGQLDDVMLFEDGMLFDGECRWRAATALGWETLRVVFVAKPKDEKTLRRRAYLTSLHRRGLNALDKAETLVAIACDEVEDLPPEDVPRIVNRVLVRLKRKKQFLGDRIHLQPTEQQKAVLEQLDLENLETQVLSVFLSLQEHPTSLNRNIFPTLNLASDLKEAIRQRRLGCAQALILNQLSAKKLYISEKAALALRQKGVEFAISSSLSTAQTQQWVTEQKRGLLNSNVKPARNRQCDQIITSIRELNLSEMSLLPEQHQELKQALEAALYQLSASNEVP